MTYKEAFENVLVELNKVQAPALLIDDFVYLFNKAVQKYLNKRYNTFEVSQQLTDDLRVLLRTKKLIPLDINSQSEEAKSNIFKDSWTVELPDDYMHILNCVCEFKNINKKKCNTSCTTFQVGANKMDTSEWPHIINNYYMQPSVKRPYYYISNIEDQYVKNQKIDSSGNPIIDEDGNYIYDQQNKTRDTRYGNSTKPVMQIKCGNDRQKQVLNAVYIDYLRAPKYISIEQLDLDSVEDKTPQLEFPDYVVFEIINELVTLILENGRDPRIQTFPQVGQSIPSQTTR